MMDAGKLAFISARVFDLPVVVGEHEVHRDDGLVRYVRVVVEGHHEAPGLQPSRHDDGLAPLLDWTGRDYDLRTRTAASALPAPSASIAIRSRISATKACSRSGTMS